jgi:hypothetical protein
MKIQGCIVLFASISMVFVDTLAMFDDSLCTKLATSQVINMVPMRDYLTGRQKVVCFTSDVFLVSLENGLKAVFKTCEALHGAYAEVAAYKASRFLDIDLVPPTIIRTINDQTGSLQLFIESSFDLTESDEKYDWALEHADGDNVANLKMFCFVFGQWDTGRHNLLVAKSGDSLKFVAIDNAGIADRQYVHYGEYPFVKIREHKRFDTQDWGANFPFDKAEMLKKVDAKTLYSLFKGVVGEERCHNLSKKTVRYVFYRNALWIQHSAAKAFSYTSYYPSAMVEKLKSLTSETLRSDIFGHVPPNYFLTDDYLEAILERRDQLIAHYEISEKSTVCPLLIFQNAR